MVSDMRVIGLIQRLRSWLERQIEEAGLDPQVFGFTKLTDEEVMKFYNEHCSGLEYSECITTIENMYPGLRFRAEADSEAYRFAMQELQHYFGTTKISEAFKQFVKRYNYNEILDMLADTRGTDLEVFKDYVIGKYGAEDIDIRQFVELIYYGAKTHVIHQGDERLFYNQVIQYLNGKPAKIIDMLTGAGDCLRLAHRNPEALLLIAIFDSVENIILPVTQSDVKHLLIVYNKCNKRVGIVW